MSSLGVLESPREQEPPVVADPEPFYEVISGRRVEMPPMSNYAVKVASRLARLLGNFAHEHDLGEVVTEDLFQIPIVGDPERNRRPDVAFVSYTRWPKDRPEDYDENAWPTVPDLAIEVVSPNDKADEQLQKLADYFQAGVREVWVVYPRQRVVFIHKSLLDVRGVADELDGGEMFPGLRLALAAIFGPAPPAATPPTNGQQPPT